MIFTSGSTKIIGNSLGSRDGCELHLIVHSQRLNLIVNVVPWFKMLLALIVPPSASTIDFTIYRPIPLPGISAIVTFLAR